MPRGRGAQFQDARIGRIMRLALLDRLDASFGRNARRVEVRLTHREVDHVLSGVLPPQRLLLDCHDDRRLEVGEVLRALEGHQRMTPYRRRISSVASSGSASMVPRRPVTALARNIEL